MWKKNDTVTITAADIAHDGSAICKTKDGFVVFVPNLLIGETADVIILKVLKNTAYAKIKELTVPSPYRTSVACNISKRCGGCAFHHTTYENECNIKRRLIQNAFRPMGNTAPQIAPVIPSEKALCYRNKMLLPVGTNADGMPVSGFFRRKSHAIIPCRECAITYPEFFPIIQGILRHMEENRISPYHEETHTGIVRHIFLRRGEHTGEIMVGLVVNCNRNLQSVLRTEKLTKRLLQTNSRIGSIGININTEKTNIILGNRTVTVYGSPYLTDSMNGIRFRISLPSFYQVNTLQAERLYQKALNLLGDGYETVFDLYCGIGTLTLHLARNAKKVYGIESCEPAVEDAKMNQQLNGIQNVTFLCGKAEEEVPKLIAKGMMPDAVVVDPPRSGCDPSLLATLLTAHPKKIVYISCNPATLARDMKILFESGYYADTVYPYDLFPRTTHVETLALLSCKKR